MLPIFILSLFTCSLLAALFFIAGQLTFAAISLLLIMPAGFALLQSLNLFSPKYGAKVDWREGPAWATHYIEDKSNQHNNGFYMLRDGYQGYRLYDDIETFANALPKNAFDLQHFLIKERPFSTINPNEYQRPNNTFDAPLRLLNNSVQ